MKKRTTIADIARAAGVSMMTVSRAVNNKPGLSDELRQKILALADEMNFRPSQIARGLATRQSSTVGLVVPDITNPFFAQIARGVEDAAYEYEYNVFLINTAEDAEREASALNSLWQLDIDGAILCSMRLSAEILTPAVGQFPAAVLLNRELKTPMSHVVTINVNDQRGAMLAVDHLLTLGRSRIGFIAGPSYSVSSQRRMEGYKQALKNAGLPYDSQFIEHCLPDTDCGRSAAELLLTRVPDLDGIFAFNDLVAVGALQACQEAKRSVPEQVAIVGADDIPLASIVRPQLSTLRINTRNLGRLAMRTLLEIFNGQGSPAAYQIEPELVLRGTT